jgi:hypothetical protein
MNEQKGNTGQAGHSSAANREKQVGGADDDRYEIDIAF